MDGALKLHLVFDPIANRTTCFAVTSARVNDVTAAKRFPIEPGVRYVFDKGYYCFAFWAKLAAAGCQFVTRLKTNTPVRIIRTRRLPKAAPHVLKDQIGYLPKRLAASRKNPFAQPVRLVTRNTRKSSRRLARMNRVRRSSRKILSSLTARIHTG